MSVGFRRSLNRSPKRGSPARGIVEEVRKPRKACTPLCSNMEREEMRVSAGVKLRSAGALLARAARRSAGEPGPGSRVQPAEAGSLGGRNVRRASAREGFGPLWCGFPGRRRL